MVREHSEERHDRELTLDITALCLGKYPDRLPRGEAPRTRRMRHAYLTYHTIAGARNLSTRLEGNPRGGLRASIAARAQRLHAPSRYRSFGEWVFWYLVWGFL